MYVIWSSLSGDALSLEHACLAQVLPERLDLHRPNARPAAPGAAGGRAALRPLPGLQEGGAGACRRQSVLRAVHLPAARIASVRGYCTRHLRESRTLSSPALAKACAQDLSSSSSGFGNSLRKRALRHDCGKSQLNVLLLRCWQGNSSQSVEEQDPFVTQKMQGYWDWAKNESRMAIINPVRLLSTRTCLTACLLPFCCVGLAFAKGAALCSCVDKHDWT